MLCGTCPFSPRRGAEQRREKRGAGASAFGYFWGNAKSDWPRAAMERDGGKDQSSFHEATLTLALSRLRERRPICASRIFTRWIPGCAEDDARWACPLTLTLSRAAGEGTELRAYDLRNRSFCPRQTIVNIRIRNIQRWCKAQNIIAPRRQKHDTVAMAGLHEFACAVVVLFD